MMRCKKMFTVLALVAPLAVGALMASPITTFSEASAGRGLANLCYSTDACEYGPHETAPELSANVCWNGSTVTLMGVGGCTSAQGLGYHLEYGLVIDPLSNVVLAIQPVIDTCVAGFCVPNQIDAGDIIIDGVACCNPKTGDCEAPDENGVCTVGDVTWCEKLEDNGDGTVTCHE